ncbi:MAG: iron ABC transporter permease [Elusimicrobia bacterium]|nr:iron ABC transporter permease [Candidatus Liberimonas magnetica]
MNKKSYILLSLSSLLLVSAVISLMFGGSSLTFAKVFNALIHTGNTDITSTIIWDIRFPRILLAILVGMGLASSGCVFQGMLRNPLADPYTLGLSGGAAFGITLGIFLGLAALSPLFIPLCASIGALFSITILYYAASRKNFSLSTMILCGVIIGFLFSSLVLVIVFLSDAQKIHTTMVWLMGDLSSTQGPIIRYVSVFILPGIVILSFMGFELNILTLGDEKASYLGIDIFTIKKILFVTASLVTGACVAGSGIVGFVGLIIPHATRRFVGPDHKILIPASALSGAVFLILCDIFARTVFAPVELPVGIITGLLGGIFFLFFLLKSRRDRIF